MINTGLGRAFGLWGGKRVGKFFSVLSVRDFVLACVLYYALLFFDLQLIAMAMTWNKSDPAGGLKFYVAGAAGCALALALASRVDLLWLNYRIHRFLLEGNRFVQQRVLSAMPFYLRSFAFYLFICVGLAMMVIVEGQVHPIISLYLTFLLLSIFGANVDYLIPSYKRYQRLRFENQLGGSEPSSKAIMRAKHPAVTRMWTGVAV